MMFTIPELVILAAAAAYLCVALVLVTGVRRVRTYELPAELPSVSVIVCARNEEDAIERCLDSLLLVDYPREKLEVILREHHARPMSQERAQEIQELVDRFKT